MLHVMATAAAATSTCCRCRRCGCCSTDSVCCQTVAADNVFHANRRCRCTANRCEFSLHIRWKLCHWDLMLLLSCCCATTSIHCCAVKKWRQFLLEIYGRLSTLISWRSKRWRKLEQRSVCVRRCAREKLTLASRINARTLWQRRSVVVPLLLQLLRFFVWRSCCRVVCSLLCKPIVQLLVANFVVGTSAKRKRVQNVHVVEQFLPWRRWIGPLNLFVFTFVSLHFLK